ncbi:hypothetical protein [Micromonospora sp. IBSANI012]|uniref:hypothetical protein n=1 Tax=Micromonospora sp. IBSANI012 TaxID=3457761 RepID=UPI00405820FA
MSAPLRPNRRWPATTDAAQTGKISGLLLWEVAGRPWQDFLTLSTPAERFPCRRGECRLLRIAAPAPSLLAGDTAVNWLIVVIDSTGGRAKIITRRGRLATVSIGVAVPRQQRLNVFNCAERNSWLTSVSRSPVRPEPSRPWMEAGSTLTTTPSI